MQQTRIMDNIRSVDPHLFLTYEKDGLFET